MAKAKKVHNPLFHIVKRDQTTWKYNLVVRVIAIVLALIVSAVVIALLTKKNPLDVYSSMISGAFGSSLRIWSLLQEIAILLCVSLAIIFKSEFRPWLLSADMAM